MKTYMRKVGKTLLFGLVILALFFILNNIHYQEKTLPDGTVMLLDRFNGTICVKPVDCNFYYYVDKEGNISYKDNINNEEIDYVNATKFNNFYEMNLSVFKGY